jgi:hypothetical protein
MAGFGRATKALDWHCNAMPTLPQEQTTKAAPSRKQKNQVFLIPGLLNLVAGAGFEPATFGL